MRGSSPRQKEQKGSSGSSACGPVSPVAPRPRAAGGGSHTSSTSQSEQRVNPGRYSALHCGQNMVKREPTTPRNIYKAVKHCAATQCALPLYFLLFAKSFETGRKLLYLNTLFVTLKNMYFMVLCVENSRPHPRASSQSVSLLPFSLYVLTSLLLYPLFRAIPFLFTLLRTLWHAPKLDSFLFNDFRTLCRETPGVGVPTLFVKGFSPAPPHLRLFATSFRIPVRMSASISCLTSQWSGFSATQALASPTLLFSALMGNEAKTIARGLQKRDPDLLDRLIEQY